MKNGGKKKSVASIILFSVYIIYHMHNLVHTLQYHVYIVYSIAIFIFVYSHIILLVT